MAKQSSGLEAKLKALDPQVKKYVSDLEKKNTKLELQVATLKLKQVALFKRIEAFQKEHPAEALTAEEVKRQTAELEDRFIESLVARRMVIRTKP